MIRRNFSDCLVYVNPIFFHRLAICAQSGAFENKDPAEHENIEISNCFFANNLSGLASLLVLTTVYW